MNLRHEMKRQRFLLAAKLGLSLAVLFSSLGCSRVHKSAVSEAMDVGTHSYASKDTIATTMARLSSSKEMAQVATDNSDFLKSFMPAGEMTRSGKKIRFSDGHAKSIEGNTKAQGDVDLRGYDTPIKSQANRPWCTAFATVATMENLAKQQTGTIYNLSEIHLWSQYRVYSTPASLQAATQTYIVAESVWPYWDDEPNQDLDDNGLIELGDYRAISDFSEIGDALARSHPVAFYFDTTSPFAAENGVLNPNWPASGYSHAVAIVGIEYDSRAPGGGWFIIKNSHGTDVGDGGYLYMPFTYCDSYDCGAYEVMSISIKGANPNPVPSNNPSVKLSVGVQYDAQDGNYYPFRLFLQGDSASLDQVSKVVYDIHPTFPNEYWTATERANNFLSDTYSTYATGWKTKGTKVYLKSGGNVELGGVEIDPGSRPVPSNSPIPSPVVSPSPSPSANCSAGQVAYRCSDGHTLCYAVQTSVDPEFLCKMRNKVVSPNGLVR